jgi:hypothetical protein
MSKDKGVGLRAGKPSAGSKSKELALSSLMEENQTVRVNFDLDRDEHIKLKIYAARNGKTVAEVLRDLISKIE